MGFKTFVYHDQGTVHVLFISVSLFSLIFQSFFRGELYYFRVQQFQHLQFLVKTELKLRELVTVSRGSGQGSVNLVE